jgi:hypothetical protein
MVGEILQPSSLLKQHSIIARIERPVIVLVGQDGHRDAFWEGRAKCAVSLMDAIHALADRHLSRPGDEASGPDLLTH